MDTAVIAVAIFGVIGVALLVLTLRSANNHSAGNGPML